MLEHAGLRGRASSRARVLRADLDHHRSARRRAPVAAAARSTRCTRTPTRACRSSALEPSCLAVLRSDAAELLATRGPPTVAARRPDPRRAADRAPGWTPPDLDRRRGRGPAALPPRRVSAGRPTRRCSQRRRAADPGRRLLRPGRQLRHREGPLRGVGGGRRDAAAAGGARRRRPTRWCSPTASPAAPSSTTSPTYGPMHLAELLGA